MVKFTYATTLTAADIRKVAVILSSEDKLPRRKNVAAEIKRFEDLAGDNLKKFKTGAEEGNLVNLVNTANKIAGIEPEAVPADTPAQPAAEAATTDAEKAKKKKAAAKPAKGKRSSKFADKVIKNKSAENPRREGTHGHRSMEIIMKAGKKGITYAAYIEAGGRNNDLNWDVEKDNVELVDTK